MNIDERHATQGLRPTRGLTMLSLFAVLAMAAGCAATPGVVSQGGGRFLLTRQGAAVGESLANLRSLALSDADAYCRGTNQDLEVIRSSVNDPPYNAENVPRVELAFRCRPS